MSTHIPSSSNSDWKKYGESSKWITHRFLIFCFGILIVYLGGSLGKLGSHSALIVCAAIMGVIGGLIIVSQIIRLIFRI